MSKSTVLELAKKIEDENLIVIDGDNGIGQLKETAVEALLPEGMTVDTYNEANKRCHEIGSAIAIAFGRQSKAVFDKNNNVKETVLKANVAKHSTIEVDVKREHTYTHKLHKDDKGNPIETTVTTKGHVTLSRNFTGLMPSSTIRSTVQEAYKGLSD